MSLRMTVSKNERLLVLFLLAISSVYVMFSSDVGTGHRALGGNRHSKELAVYSPELKHNDKIYHGKTKWWNPIVVEQYNLVFFHVPKVACTEFKLMFMKMKDEPDFDVNVVLGTIEQRLTIHNPTKNGLRYLSDYPKARVEEMMTSDKWTRAVFLREPKERVLSSYLDKVLRNDYFAIRCCIPNYGDAKECRKNKDFSYFLRRTLDCHDPHWSPQANTIDKKWWPSINFIGYMNNLSEDAEKLLKQLHDSNGETAWHRHGTTGWGPTGKGAFLARDEAVHATSAHDKLRQYYSSCDEEYVEQHWEEDWEIPGVDFEEMDLYNHDVVACEG